MKKKLSVILAGIFFIACLPLNINASAGHWYNICEDENIGANAVVAYLEKTDTGYVEYYLYFNWTNEFVYASSGNFAPYLENNDTLIVGDLLKIEDAFVLPTYPGKLSVQDDTTIEYCGNGIELLGREFEKTLLNQVCYEMNCYNSMMEELGYTVVRGDATEDDEIDMLDVVTVTKAVLGKLSLSDYAECVSDMNENGQVDALDALLIMQYVVGVVDMR
ncbi:MAG: dockerin type I repeat-containing protein [Oscillospiraceae bacterium]|nr:dockerin type I repeat-containing protein [Oscillospiraceae bacterium]